MISQSVSLKRFLLLSTGPWYPFMSWPFGCLIVLLYFVFQIYGTVWSSWNTFFCSLILDSLVIWPCWLILNSLRHSSLPSFCDATLTYFYLTSVTVFSLPPPQILLPFFLYFARVLDITSEIFHSLYILGKLFQILASVTFQIFVFSWSLYLYLQIPIRHFHLD